MLDTLIKNALVVDGTGNPTFRADVGILNGQFAIVAEDVETAAKRIIEARDLHLAPGFIDPHSHSDFTLLADPKAQSKIQQGVTTEVIGNCGFSAAPLYGAAMEEVEALAKQVGVTISWASMAEYLEHLRKSGTAVNVVALVGHNTVRGSVLGYDNLQPTAEQNAQMERLVGEAMGQGARGFSTGLFYPPGCYAQQEEVIRLSRVAARYDGIYAAHIRNESDGVLEALTEALEIAEQAEIQLEVAHIKLSGHRSWGNIDPLLRLLEEANSRGVKAGCDQYPYAASSTWLTVILPYWAQKDGIRVIKQRLQNPEMRTRIIEDWEKNRAEWDGRSGVYDWSDILITDCDAGLDAVGKNIAEIAGVEGKKPLEAALDLIVMSERQVEGVFFDQLEDNVRTLMQHPLVVVGSDASAISPLGVLGQSKTHPRTYGTFPRVLGHYVREEKVLSLAEAVRKMTYNTAERFGLTDRGVIREGAWADLVLFDADVVIDKASFLDPHRYPEGMAYVFVNGEIVIENGQHTGALPGKVL
jgi:N-acyl-D-amino-acid deacylase